MKSNMTKVILATLTAVGSSSAAFADHDSHRRGDRDSVEAQCEAQSGNLTAIVTTEDDQPFIEVFADNELIAADYAEKSYSYSGGVLIVSYNTGAVTQGGVSLRIRKYDNNAENLEGFGHLTLKVHGKFINKLMDCYVY